MIALVKRHGAKQIYPDWTGSTDELIAELQSITPRQYAEDWCGCDHCDDDGRCLGHGGRS